MKKRLLSLLVALCMAVTLLPVSAITAWAEESSSNSTTLRIKNGYPVGSGGEDWSYDGTTLDLHPASSTEYDFLSIISGNGNVTKCKLTIGGNATIVRGNFDNTVINNGKISGGYFYSSSPLTNHGTIIDGLFVSAVSNESEGKIENGTFKSTVTNNGTIKGGIFHKKPEDGQVADGYTLKVNSQQNGSYESFDIEISYFGNSGYVIPNSNHNTSITIYISLKNSQAVLFPIDVTFGDSNDTHCLFEDWAPSARYYDNGSGYFSVTFTAPPAKAGTVTLSKLTRLVIDKAGYPVGTEGGTQNYSGNGWSYNHTDKTLTLNPSTPTSYDFFVIHTGYSNTTDCNLIIGKNATVTDGHFIASVTNNGTIKGGIFKDAVTNHGTIIGGRFFSSVTNELDGIIENGQFGIDPSPCTVTNNGGTINGGTFKDELTGSGIELGYTLTATMPIGFEHVLVNKYRDSCYIIPNQASVSVDIRYHFDDKDGFPNLPPLDVTIDNAQHMLLSDWCGSDLKIEFDGISGRAYKVTFTAPSANGSTVTISPLTRLVIDENGYPVGTEGGTRDYSGNGWKFEKGNSTLTLTSGSYDFSALRSLSSDVHLVVDGATIVNPEPKPEPKPKPEASTYTLTVKGGTFTYNGGEAMTSASVPVDAEVKVTLNQSAVPEGMVFDLWAIDEASLLGNPAVAYNEESFTIPAGTVAKGSTVTVEAQYRDATIESEPSILGTAAIIGVAGAGTAVIVWQGYRIGMELYEKYFQPTPEEDAVVEPTLESQMTDPIS